MIDRLETFLEGEDRAGMRELQALVCEALGGREVTGRFVDQERLARTGVFRAQFEVEGRLRSLVVKQLPIHRSERERYVTRHWLGSVGLAPHAPPLIGIAVGRDGETAWHVYEDLGRHELAATLVDRRAVGAAVEVIAQVHVRFALHPLLAEVRLVGCDLGVPFVEASLRDAFRNITHMLTIPTLTARAREVAMQLREKLEILASEQSERSRRLALRGGPETLLHGDLWPINILMVPRADGFAVRLIDWERCGVGPVVYDLSAFLRQFPEHQRAEVLETYRRSVPAEWTIPEPSDFNEMCETMELARFANSITWRAMAVGRAQPGAPPSWAITDLEEIVTWFETLRPMLPHGDASKAAGEKV